MTGFFWNVRGFNKFSKHKVVREWIQNKGLQFGGLLETRVKENKAGGIASSVFQGWSFINNYEFSRKGRIWVLWNSQVRLTPVFKSDQLVTVSVLLEGEKEEFFCSFVYGENIAEKRKELWKDLKDHQDASIFRNKEWVIMGDFNEVLEGEEHSSYQDSGLVTSGMRDFESVIQHCRLTDMGYQGPHFTWCNKRDEGTISKKLDRILVNEKWLHNRTQAYGVFEAGGISDHLRGRFHTTAEAVGKRKPFKFTNVVAETPEFMEVIGNYWKDTQSLFQSTSALYRFSKYLKGLKPHLRTLSKSKLGSLTKKVKEAYSDLCEKQEQLISRPTTVNVNAEREVSERWKRVSDIEEKVLKHRSKLHWLLVGDKNNKAFYNAAKIRESRNAIREIKCANGNYVNTQDDIKKEAERFFNEFLTFVPSDIKSASVEELKETIPYRCTDEERAKLIRVVTEEEIKEVVFKMPSNKSPGPDGYTTEFFKAWSITKNDFTAAVQSFSVKGSCLKV